LLKPHKKVTLHVKPVYIYVKISPLLTLIIETGGVFCEVQTKSEETIYVVNTRNEHNQAV
jgi:hypothetical protein